MTFYENLVAPMGAAVTSVSGWCTTVFAAAFSAFWLGLSLGLERWLSPLDAISVAVLSPLAMSRVPSLVLIYLAVGLACYLPIKAERSSGYLLAILAVATTVLFHAWHFSEAARRLLRIFDFM